MIAPTGTIGLLMDCDTTGVEPDFALTKFKARRRRLLQDCQPVASPALRALRPLDREQIDDISSYVMGTLAPTPMPDARQAFGSSDGAPRRTFRQFTSQRDTRARISSPSRTSLPVDVRASIRLLRVVDADRVLLARGTDRGRNAKPGFNGLRAFGLCGAQIDSLNRLNRVICGTQTVEGAHLRPGIAGLRLR